MNHRFNLKTIIRVLFLQACRVTKHRFIPIEYIFGGNIELLAKSNLNIEKNLFDCHFGEL